MSKFDKTVIKITCGLLVISSAGIVVSVIKGRKRK